jgi:hypothetical protein
VRFALDLQNRPIINIVMGTHCVSAKVTLVLIDRSNLMMGLVLIVQTGKLKLVEISVDLSKHKNVLSSPTRLMMTKEIVSIALLD